MKTSKEPKYFDVQRLVVYSELLTKMIYDIDDVGMRATRAAETGIITKDKMAEIHEKLIPTIENIEPKRIAIVKELNKRIKAEIGLTKGTTDLDEYLHGFKSEYPDIFLTKAEFDYKQKSKADKDVKDKVKVKLKKT
jgi:uncharacterized short protein YbdD (DUF466 family)